MKFPAAVEAKEPIPELSIPLAPLPVEVKTPPPPFAPLLEMIVAPPLPFPLPLDR